MSVSSEQDCDTCTSLSDSYYNRYDRDGEDEGPSKGRLNFTQWENVESQRLEMINEAKDKVENLEKTMRWWAECTALWRDKWSRVRHERNQARATVEALMQRLQEIQDEHVKYFDAKEEAEQEVQRLRNEVNTLKEQLGPSPHVVDPPEIQICEHNS